LRFIAISLRSSSGEETLASVLQTVDEEALTALILQAVKEDHLPN
jgi:hypothetical protein